jgi:hypothetical protein
LDVELAVWALLKNTGAQEENLTSTQGLSVLELQALRDFASKNRKSVQRVTERLFEAGLTEVMRLGKPESTEMPALLPTLITLRGHKLLDSLTENK